MIAKLKELDISRFIFLSILPQILVLIISFFLISIGLNFDKYGVIQTAIVLPISFVIIPYIFLLKTGSKLNMEDVGLRKFKKQEIIIFIVIMCAITLIVYLRGEFDYSIIFFAIQTFVVSTSEEIWARGMLIYELKRSKFSWFLCVIISSLIFAFLTHQNRPIFENLINRFPFAILMGFLYYKTEKIEVPILIHFSNNMIGGI